LPWRKGAGWAQTRPSRGGDRAVALVFRDLATAEAAFALGQVEYRCLVCGRVHRSGTGDAAGCLDRLERHGWRGYVGPYPPEPAVTPAYWFVVQAWREALAGLSSDAPASCGPSEALLALDPAGDVRGEVERYFRERLREGRVFLDRVWRLWSDFVEWRHAVEAARPPAAVARVSRHAWGRPAPISSWSVRPAVSGPLGDRDLDMDDFGAEEIIKKHIRGPCWDGAVRLVHVEYGPEAFVAVLGYVPVMTYCALLVYREPYGGAAEDAFYPLPEGADAARFLEEALARFRG